MIAAFGAEAPVFQTVAWKQGKRITVLPMTRNLRAYFCFQQVA